MNQEELEERFDDMLNDCYPAVKIGYIEFSPADILKSCDPIAYRVGVSDYEDYEKEETL